MSPHLSTAAGWLMLHIGVSIQCSKVLLHGKRFDGHHERLIAVVTASPIACFELFCQSNLCQFFTIAKYSELGFSGKYFLSSQQRRFAGNTR